jgi:hypothetical protein
LKISYEELVHTYETDMTKEKDKFKAILSEKAKMEES